MGTKLVTNDTIPTTPWGFFIFVSKEHKKWAFIAMFAVSLAAVLSVSTSYFFKLIIEAVENKDIGSAMQWGLLYPVVTLGIQLIYRASGYAGMRWTVGSNKTATDILLSYLLNHSHNYYINRFAGSVTSKVRNVTSAFDEIIPDFLWAHLNALVIFTVTFLFILQVDLFSAGIFLGLIAVLFTVNKHFAPKKVVVARAHAEAGTALQGRMVDVLSNAATVRQYVQNKFEFENLQTLTKNKYNSGIQNWSFTEKLLLLNSGILFIFAFAMFWLLVSKWGQGIISTGDFVLVLALISNITGTLLFIGRAFNATARTAGEMREGLDDIFLPHDLVDDHNALPLTVPQGSIIWNKADFSFDGVPVFSNFNLTIEQRQRIGLVGSSGAGKSTFVSLLLRQYNLASGQILIDNQDIATITQDSLRASIAIVPQEPSLFHRSIKENIAYSRPEATLDEIIEIAKKAQAHEFIVKLPQGYDTLVGERGVKLSGGQKQRVAIARAMLKNAPILILDEATSALDSESEREIQKALHILMENKTVIAIAHRLSTIREMDRILVLEDGRVVEDGNHQILLERNGQYAKLWSHQAGGFILE